MNILAIDPGPTQSACVLWDGSKVLGHGILDNDSVIREWIGLRDTHNCLLAIEMIASYGMAVGREVFETCVWIGRFMEAWRNEKTTVRIPRGEIKIHLCKSAKAKDANIRQALIDRFGGKDAAIGKKATPGPLYGIASHEWSALAVAVCAHDRAKIGL